MKTRSILFSMLFAATAFALFSNCSGNKKEEATESHQHEASSDTSAAASSSSEASSPQFSVDPAFQKQLAEVFTAYILLKEAFVSSDVSKVKAQSATMKQSVSKTDMKLLSGAAHNDWMNYLVGIDASLKEMEGTNDIALQRKAFSGLTENLYKSIKAYGLDGTDAYYDFCPMAFNNEGGFWLSDESKIRNPYFGDEMLTCGEVKEKLQ